MTLLNLLEALQNFDLGSEELDYLKCESYFLRRVHKLKLWKLSELRIQFELKAK